MSPVKRALLTICLLGIAARFYHLFQPMRLDEATTYINFVKQPITGVIADYSLPNNHVFHTLVQKFFVMLLDNELWVLRLPAFLAGCAIIPLTWLVARRISNTQVALLSSAMVAGSGALILYSTNARGYSMVIVATLILVLIVFADIDAPRRWHWPLFAVVAALGLWTIPTMLYSLGGIVIWTCFGDQGSKIREQGAKRSVWLEFFRNRLFLSTLAATIAGGMLAGILYLPIIRSSGLSALTRNPFVSPRTFETFLSESLVGLGDNWKLFTVGWPTLIPVILLAAIVIGISIRLLQRPHRMSVLMAMVTWGLVLLLATQRFPFPRVWLYLMPFLAIAGAEGTLWVADRIPRAAALMHHPFFAVAIAVVLGGTVIATQGIFQSRETSTFIDAEQVARRIKTNLRPGDQVQVATVAPLMYWFERVGIDSGVIMTEGHVRARRIIMVINEYEGESVERNLQRMRYQPRAFVAETLGSFPHSKVVAVTPR